VPKSLTSGGDPNRRTPGPAPIPGSASTSAPTPVAAGRGGIPIDTQSEEVLLSHTVQIQTEVRDPTAVATACRRLGLPEPVHGTARLFSGAATGLLVKLPDWLYPIVCDTASGTLAYDNFNGSWGRQEQLDRFMQRYALEKAALEARRRGHSVVEQSLPDGSVRLTIRVGGAQ
jgi:hypothetical protein